MGRWGELCGNRQAALPGFAWTHSLFSLLRALKFPGLFCDFGGLECDRAGQSITK